MQTPWRCCQKSSPKSVGTTRSGSFLQKPPEPLVYVIYIERWSPFCYCYIISLNTRCGWGGNRTPSGRILFKPQPICLKFATIIYLTHAQMVMTSDFLFSSPFIGKRDSVNNVTRHLLHGVAGDWYMYWREKTGSIVVEIYARRGGRVWLNSKHITHKYDHLMDTIQ